MIDEISNSPFEPPPLLRPANLDPPPYMFDRTLRPFCGLELTVSGLDSATPTSAVEDLNSIIESLKEEGSELPDLTVTHGPKSEEECSDYATVSLVDTSPRPDILENVRVTLDDVPRLVARWSISYGDDPSRKLKFYTKPCLEEDEDGCSGYSSDTKDVQIILNKIFKLRRCAVQSTHAGWESITYNFFDHASALEIIKKPPNIDGWLYHPSTPRFIQPNYGLEVAITNVNSLPDAKEIIDGYIRDTYGDEALCQSRVERGGSVYCAVLRDPDITLQFLSTPITLFDEHPPERRPRKPTYLYSLNSIAACYCPKFPTEECTLTREEEAFLQKKLEATAERVMATNRRMVQQDRRYRRDIGELMNRHVAFTHVQNEFTNLHTDIETLKTEVEYMRYMGTTGESEHDGTTVEGVDRQIEALETEIQGKTEIQERLAHDMPLLQQSLNDLIHRLQNTGQMS
ncbi:hypothetical protein H0H92_005140 [Tricholoma furcatifolium]|nr:hypothetical protein H0H92_005140 [Tricholoma furcatifolium]